jgi:hypothetical protein
MKISRTKIMIFCLALVVILVSMYYIITKVSIINYEKQHLISEFNLYMDSSINTAIATYISESEDVKLTFGDNQSCNDINSLINHLMNTITYNSKPYGPYLDKSHFQLGKEKGAIDSSYRTKDMIENGLFWNIVIYTKSGKVKVTKEKGNNKIRYDNENLYSIVQKDS